MARVQLPLSEAETQSRRRRLLPRWLKRKNISKVLLYSLPISYIFPSVELLQRIALNVRPFWVVLFVLSLPYPLYLLVAPNVAVPLNHFILHFLTFFILTACLYWSISLPPTLPTTSSHARFSPLLQRLPLLVAGLLSLIAATLSEVLQSLLPYKEFSPLDILFNILGLTLSLTLSETLERRRKERVELSMYYAPVREESGDEDEDEEQRMFGTQSWEARREAENPWASAEEVFSLGDEEEGEMTPTSRPR